MKKHLDFSRRVHNAYGSIMSENTKAGHAYYHAMCWSFEEWDELWTNSEDIVWGHTFGRMRGQKSVWLGSVFYYDLQCCDAILKIYKLYNDLAGKDIRPLMENMMHTLANDIIEVADDGKTCRTYYMTPGISMQAMTSNGKKHGGHMWEYYGADFVYEDGQWLYLHEQVAAALGPGGFTDTNSALEDYKKSLLPPPPGMPMGPGHGFKPPILEDDYDIAGRHSFLEVPTCIIPPVKPYVTMDDENSAVPLTANADRPKEAAAPFG